MARPRLPSAILTVFVSLVALLLYNRGTALSKLYLNAPNRLMGVNHLNGPTRKFSDTVRNCEDVILDTQQGFALISCDPSRDTWNTVMGTFIDSTSDPKTGIYIWHYDVSDAQPEQISLLDFDSKNFHPLGIEYHAASGTLFVVNHAPSGSAIELFRFFPSEHAATHITTLKHVKIAAPNSIVVLSPTEILVTNDHYFRRRYHPWLALLETYLAFRGGSVAYVRLQSHVADGIAEVSTLVQLPFANGIARLNDSTIAVASSSMMAVYLYNLQQLDGSFPKLKQLHTISVGFHPDNLSVDGHGKLMIAGHPHAPTLEKLAKENRNCWSDGSTDVHNCALTGLSWVSEWTEKEGVRDLYVGEDFGSSTTAVWDVEREVGIVTGLYALGLYVWQD